MNPLILVLIISVLGLVFAVLLAKWVLSKDRGTPAMQEISNAIQQGAEAFLRRQNATIFKIAIPVALAIFVLYAFLRAVNAADPTYNAADPAAGARKLAVWTTISFAFGALCSIVAGYVGMWVSIRSNIRTASAARTSLNGALQIAMRGGAVSGFLVVSLSLLGVWGIFTIYQTFIGGVTVAEAPFLIVGFGFGASFVAL